MEASKIYLYTTIASVFITIFLFLVAWSMQRKTLRKVFNTRNITIVALLCAVSIIFTNVIGYQIKTPISPYGMKLGLFVLFMIGMLFGPMFGLIAGIICDLLGLMISSTGIAFWFTMANALFGFMGSLVFVWKTNKFVITKTVLTFSIYYLINSFIIYPIGVAGLGGQDLGTLIAAQAAIKLPIMLAIYLAVLIPSFELCAYLVQRNVSKKEFIWAFKNGPIHFKKKKSMYEKRNKKLKVVD